MGQAFLFVEVDKAVEKLLHHTLDLRKRELDLVVCDADEIEIQVIKEQEITPSHLVLLAC